MSRWLSRLGQLCARRAKTVLALWLAALFAAAGAAAAFSEGTTASYSIPDADYETVLEDLGDEIETFQGGSAVVLLSTQDGQDFTAEQRSGVASLTEEVEQVDVVLEAPDPFSQQEEMEQSREDLEEGLQDLEEGQQEIDEGQEELDEGYEELELLIAQLGEQDPVVVETEAELSTAQEELDQSQQELDESQGDLERAERQVELTEDMNTVSPQSGAALLTLQLSEEAYDLGPEQQEAIISAVEANLPDGVEADFALELVQDVTSIVGTSEIIGLAVAALVLLITLGTVVAAGLPVALALIGVGVGVAGVFALSSVVELTDTDPILALMLGLSLGIDYTLLLIYRHRGQLARGMGVRESIGLATGTAGSAIFFAGVTNVIALAALVVTGIPFLTVMGLAASATIVVVVAAVLLLGPAVLGLLGHRILPKRLRPAAVGGPSDDDFGATALTPEQNTPVRYERLSAHAQDRLMDRGWGRVITRHPWAAILLPLILLVTVALPAADLRLGLPDGGSEPQDSTAYATYDTVRDAFGAGENGPVLAVAELPEGLSETEQEEAGLDLAEEFAAMEGVARAVPAEANDAGDLRLLQIVPETGPNDEETSDLVTSLFGAQQALEQDHGLSSLGFTGQTVANIEIAERLQDAIPLYVGIVVVVAAVLLLGPAVLGLLGHRILPKRLRPAAVGGPSDDDFGATALTPEQNTPVRYERLSAHAQDRLMDRGWGRVITRHPWAAILLPLILLVTVALPAADLRLGLPDGGSEPQDSTAYATYDTVRDAFGAGENGPVLAVAELPEGLSETEQEEAGLDLAEEFAAMEGVARAVPAEANDAGDLRLLQIVPETGPNDEETSDLVTSLFGAQQALEQDHGLSSLGFTGQTVANIEIAERLQDAIPLYVGIVVVLCLVLLMAIFRSVAAPVLAAVGYVLSLAASLGAVTAIYQWGWLSEIFGVNEPGPILAFLPILICGVLFGLAIDYQLFIMSGVREAHARGSGARQAILRGLRQGGPVVLACGIIMVSVFAGFVFADLTIIRPIGFGLAFGVLVEALLVRATLIPAATYLLGEKAWWLPPWMDRLIPDVDVEGRRLEKQAQLGSPQEERSERDVQDSFRKSVEVDVC